MAKSIGRITEVKGLSVRAILDELLPPYLVTRGSYENAPKINSFVKTKVGVETIICQVVGEVSQEVNGEVKTHYLELSVKGHYEKRKFIQGLRMLPIVSAAVYLLEKEDYDIIYNDGSNNVIEIGDDLFDFNKKIKINANYLIPSHIGVFGNTGSGKSNTLVKILYEYEQLLSYKKTNKGKFLVFDINNEYSEDAICDLDKKKIYNLNTRSKTGDKIPLNISTLSEDNFIVLMNASEKTQVPAIKNAYKWTFAEDSEKRESSYYLTMMKSLLRNGKRYIFYSMRHNLSLYFKNIEHFKYHSSQNKFFYQEPGMTWVFSDDSSGQFEKYLDNIDIFLPETPLERFMFELYFAVAQENENGVQLDFMMPLISRANKLILDFNKVFDFSASSDDKNIIFDNKNVCVIQLGNVNKDMKEIVPSLITNHIFDSLARRKDEESKIVQIINIVVDEAHNILYDEVGQSTAHKNTLDVFEQVVKEGRKFGCYLLVSSQRPSDISSTIISQLHNYFIHKLVNPSDIQRIRKAVAYLDENSMDFLTVMAPGECIVSGTAVQMPSFVYINQVKADYRPRSENVILFGNNGLLEQE
ncbi:MAG: ATP-binding protein [Candidatus Izemoplasmatales bacterium]|nr:ATP-binding protein [Candidatus Izemoplasmatales bacterium]